MGTRLKSVLADRPKCLAPVGHTVFLDIQLQALRAQGVADFILSLGHLSDQVLGWLSANPQWSVAFGGGAVAFGHRRRYRLRHGRIRAG
jgi:D-glycero-alpha-D-manno-heptose 1-phosphate guanylyltransferase